jgi:hypothetical protein
MGILPITCERKRVTMQKSRISLLAAGGVAIALAWVFPIETAQAKSPEAVFKGQIITSAKSIPTTSRSESAYVSTLKKLRTKRFFENKQKKAWKIHYAAFFKKPLNDLELTIRLYDVTDGSRTLLNTFEQYLDGRGARSFTSSMELDREQVGVNRSILMVIESRGYVLASASFQILGEGPKYSGKVDFSEEETQE